MEVISKELDILIPPCNLIICLWLKCSLRRYMTKYKLMVIFIIQTMIVSANGYAAEDIFSCYVMRSAAEEVVIDINRGEVEVSSVISDNNVFKSAVKIEGKFSYVCNESEALNKECTYVMEVDKHAKVKLHIYRDSDDNEIKRKLDMNIGIKHYTGWCVPIVYIEHIR